MTNPEQDNTLERTRDFIIREMPLGKPCYISEAGLAEKLGVNRSSARKALLSLEGEGCVRSTTKGYQRIDYSQTSFRVGIVMRRALEQQAAALAATAATNRELFELAAICAEMDEAVARKDMAAFRELDFEFHRALVNASHDPLLIRMMSMVLWTLRVTTDKTFDPDGGKATQASHRRLMEAVKSRDAIQAGFRAYRHLAEGKFSGETSDENVPLPLPDSVLQARGEAIHPDGLQYYGSDFK